MSRIPGAAGAGAAAADVAEAGTEAGIGPSERYVSADPHDLMLTQELCNSIGRTRLPLLADVLQDRAGAEAWLRDAAARWCRSRDEPEPEPYAALPEEGLQQLRELRDHVRRLVASNGDEATGQPAQWATLTPLTAPIVVTLRGDCVQASPRGSGADWLASAIAVEWLLAHEHGTLRRLKLCHNTRCAVAFYDRSKNNSRVWHDLARCGNPANVRAYRARRSAAS
ncbi:MAG TPA: CGNR zinc finger domain-containing protein [Actinocrinis sp.]|jgi:predicted RNA-binding Zn ribbon-like protein